MKKLIFILFIIIAGIFPANTYADMQSESSAQLARETSKAVNEIDMRVKALENIFKRYGSPLEGEAQTYVKYADEYGVDWKLLPAIAGLESTFGKFMMPGSYNAYGWGGGHIYFESWEDGIRSINKALKRNYIDRGADNVWTIGPIYAESPTWSVRVNIFMEQINEEYRKLSIFSVLPNI